MQSKSVSFPLLFSVALLFSVSFGSLASAAVWYVDKDNSGTENGTTWSTAFNTIQEGIDAALNAGGGEVWVGEGVYGEPRTDANGSLVMREQVNLYGGFVGIGVGGYEVARDQRDWSTHSTTVDGSTSRAGGPAFHVVIGANNSTLDGFTVTGGSADGVFPLQSGGGMYNDGVSPEVVNCLFVLNRAETGGAMYNQGSSPTVQNCTFENNSAIRENDAGGIGGALYSNWECSPTILRCHFLGNSAVWGGGMYNDSGAATNIIGCFFKQNSAQFGGAMYNYPSSPTVTNCVFDANHADETGGAIGNHWTSFPILLNCTFTGNSAGVGGGSIHNSNSAAPTVTNCVLWGDVPDELTNDSASANVTYSDIQGGYPGVGNIDAYPFFVIGPGGQFRLSPASPCIDAGTVSGAPVIDIEGIPRPQLGGVDMGAYEFLSQQDSDGDGLPDSYELAQQCDWEVADASLYATIDYPSEGALFHDAPVTLSGWISSAYVTEVMVSTNGGAAYDKAATVDGLAWSYLWTPQANGTYYIWVKACNTFGGYTMAGPVKVVYHPDVPVAVIRAPVGGAHVHGTVPVTGSALAGLLGLQQYALDYHSGTDPEAPTGWVRFRTSSSQVDNGLLGSWNTSGLADGAYVLRLRITDGTGDDSYFTHVLLYVDSDSTPPDAPSELEIHSVVAPDAASNGNPVNVLGAAEAGCFAASAELVDQTNHVIKDVTSEITVHRNGSVRGGIAMPDAMSATTVALRLQVKDPAGNVSSATTSNALPVDNAPPTVQVSFPVNGATLPQDLIILAGVASDNGVAGLAKIEFSMDGSTWALATGTEAWAYHWTPPAEGPYTLHIRGTDTQGNNAEVTFNVTINSTYPSAYITSPTQGQEIARGTRIDVVGTATDTADFNNYRLQFAEGVSPDTYWTNLTADAVTAPVVNNLLGTWSTAGLAQGTYTLRLIVRDNAFNTVIFDMQVFVRDLPCEYTGLFNNELTEEPPGQGPMFAGLLPTMSQLISDLFYVIGYETWRDYDIEYLEEALNHTRERPGDGLPDRFQMALVEYSLCHPTSPHHEEAMAGFVANRAAFVSDIEDLQGSFPDLAQLLPLADLFAGMMGTSEVMHTTIDAIIRMLTDGSTGLPRLEEYVVFGTGEKAPNEPFSAQGDFDGDGISNVAEYDEVMDAGGDLSVFLEAATDTSPFWPGNPGLPVAGVAALALLTGTLAFGSTALFRRPG
jgi:hypothetical protein